MGCPLAELDYRQCIAWVQFTDCIVYGNMVSFATSHYTRKRCTSAGKIDPITPAGVSRHCGEQIA